VNVATISSPVGPLELESKDEALVGIRFHAPGPLTRVVDGVIGETARQLAEYFEGRRTRFDLPLAPAGTPFQRGVWDALQRIEFGETLSYADLAERVGRPAAVRAVGAANGRNPIPIVIPCHRVIGSNGRLVGFGGGLAAKQYLLSLERQRLF
jgi:methylated-DNA-[protein]-cysteine S-methyltransferase